MKETHITSNPRSGKLGMLNEDGDDDDTLEYWECIISLVFETAFPNNQFPLLFLHI